MIIQVNAVFKNGVLKPKKPVALSEGTKVRLTIHTDDDYDPLEAVIGIGNGPPEGDGAKNHDKYIYGKPRKR